MMAQLSEGRHALFLSLATFGLAGIDSQLMATFIVVL